MVFKLWEAFNSSLIDDRFVELCGELAEDHIAGQFGDAGAEGAAEWKSVGIWSDAEWVFLTAKALGSMSEYAEIYAPCITHGVLHRRSCWSDEGACERARCCALLLTSKL